MKHIECQKMVDKFYKKKIEGKKNVRIKKKILAHIGSTTFADERMVSKYTF